ncbi:hypothetical protein MTBPR1_10019 [Candidatus Terasakiella magnetica]|uniref:Phosphohistidine phosphatase SixA n=1 Tax=Candidatus Terasakiella magnetica TaxID=1867952 RepID=A0A1C3RC29_9PROT|nr:histidine phosphatase family protein [Candidatus Terasakiella magnetica]SCA54772.1 hypothetical protein MTBPR1_10019 [Candidatus Terasakiella magnetica]
MPKDLLILRHGDTQNSHKDGDFSRELTNTGKRNAQRIGLWLSQNDLQPEHIISSTAMRAKTTAHITCESAGLGTSIIEEDKSLYNAPPINVLESIKQAPIKGNCLMVVGHNPRLSVLVGQLSSQFIAMSPATLVHLRVEGDWADIGTNQIEFVQAIDANTLPPHTSI